MASFGRELTGISLSVLGWVLSVISCALPMWIDFSFTDQYIKYDDWWGLWMICESWSTGHMQCLYNEHIDQETKAFRALSVIAIIVGVLGVFLFMVGAKCTSYNNERVKARLKPSSGGMFITAALVQLVPVFWIVHIVTSYYNQSIGKIGAALHLGWAASVLMLIGGSILCSICPPQEDRPREDNLHGLSHLEYSATPRSTAQSSNNRRDEV